MGTHRARPIKLRRASFEQVLVAVLGLVLAFSLSFFISLGYERLDDQTMQVWFFDVGQGDATFIVTPSGKQILVDAGPDGSVLSKLGEVMPFWDRTIDLVVLTRPDADHISGAAKVLQRYRVTTVMDAGTYADTAVAQEVDRAISDEGTQHVVIEQGDTFGIDSVQFEVLWPDEVEDEREEAGRNASSIVLHVQYGDTDVLLTGDAEEESEQVFLSSLTDIDVLKVGHHGSLSSSSLPFLQATTPEHSVISCGEGNRYGHPHPVILDRLEQVKSSVFRTDLDGDVLLSSDGITYNIRSHPLIF